jgi:Fe-S-cluster-containing hydrogenase component 2
MIYDMPSCGGCRTCEMACSFVHKGEFIPSFSSIKIMDKDDGQGHKVLFVEENNTDIISCDGCLDLEEHFCIQYCPEGEELAQMVKEFIKKGQYEDKKIKQ